VLPGSILLSTGLSYSVRSGEPTNYLGGHIIYGPDQTFLVPRGSGERLPWVHSVDAHLGAGFKLSKDSDVQITVDAFNLFNFQTATATDQRYTLDSITPKEGATVGDDGLVTNPDGSKIDKTNPNFGNPVAYQAPRTFRLGARVTF
jgi:hypothetical protein